MLIMECGCELWDVGVDADGGMLMLICVVDVAVNADVYVEVDGGMWFVGCRWLGVYVYLDVYAAS